MTTENAVDTGGQTAVVEQKTDDYVLASESGENATETEQDKAAKPAEENTNDEQSEKPRKQGGYQRKIFNLTNENALLRQQLAEYQQQKAQVNQPQAKTQPQTGASDEPQMEDYESVLDYLKAHNEWMHDRKYETRQKEQEAAAKQQKDQQEYETKQTAFDERIEQDILKSVPDFYDRAQALYDQGLITPAMENAVLDSPIGHMVSLYYMAHPQELEALAGMTEAQTYRAVALVESKLLQSSAPAQQNVNRRPTAATPPISPVKPSASTQVSIRDELPYEEWVKVREKSLRG